MRMAGTVIIKAADELIARGKRLAAIILDKKEDNITFTKGIFTAECSNASINLFEVAAALKDTSLQKCLPEELRGPFQVCQENQMHTQVFPNGAQVCELEIDPETGAVAIKNYVAVDDVGRAINPLIVKGQTHGGAVQGIGQALFEKCTVDPNSGQPLSATFLDYAIPRADHFPTFLTELNEVHSPTNPLGIKAGGEGGTTGALAAVVNAIVDALKPYGIQDIQMPVTPFKIWQAINSIKNQP